MKFVILATLMAAVANADFMVITTSCPKLGGNCNSVGEWHNNHGNVFYGLNVNEGCRQVDVVNVQQICMDWRNKRMHFFAIGQSKRCMRAKTNSPGGDCADTSKKCYRDTWDEVPCNW